jgi:hypothetical protein
MLVFNLTWLDVSFDTRDKDWFIIPVELRANYHQVKNMFVTRYFASEEIVSSETREQIIGCEM